MSRYVCIPRVFDEQGNCNLPDELWMDIWDIMVVEGKDRIVFYHGTAHDHESFLVLMKSPHNFPILVWDTVDNIPVFLAWLNDAHPDYANGHFCAIGRYRKGSVEACLNFWQELVKPDGTPMLKVIVGVTPGAYEGPLRLLKLTGAKQLCTIPHINLVVSIYDLEARRTASLMGGQKWATRAEKAAVAAVQ